jgi:hypothetical protein
MISNYKQHKFYFKLPFKRHPRAGKSPVRSHYLEAVPMETLFFYFFAENSYGVYCKSSFVAPQDQPVYSKHQRLAWLHKSVLF